MNITLKMFMPKRRRGARQSHFRLMYPAREWLVGLLLSSIIFGCGAVYAGWLFLTGMRHLDEAPQATTQAQTVYNHAKVTKVLKEYKARAARFKELSTHTNAPAISATQKVSLVASTTPSGTLEPKIPPAVAEDGSQQVE